MRSRYDAFGNGVKNEGAISNKYLFAGEQFDSGLGDYYLRDRFYDLSSGRFTRRDIYEGAQGQPLTLHKYSYTHNNPVSYIDPTGLYTQQDGYNVEAGIEQAYAIERSTEYPHTTFGRWAVPRFGVNIPSLPVKPDILNFHGLATQTGSGLFNEIKPLSPGGVSAGISQIVTYFLVLEPHGFVPDVLWHAPPNVLTLPGIEISGKGRTNVLVFNVGGILFYTDDSSRRMRQNLQQLTYSSFSEGIEKVRALLLTASNSTFNELGRSKYLVESAQNTMYAANFALLAALIATAALARI